MEDMMPKVEYLRKNYKDLDIGVDGGITIDNVEIVAKAGANIIISGSGIYSENIKKFLNFWLIKFMNK